MNPSQPTHKNTKLIAGAVVLVAVALIVVATQLILSKKATSPDATNNGTSNTTQNNSNTTSTTYKDGTYTGQGSYDSPGGLERVTVTVTLKDGAVADTNMTSQATGATGRGYQDQFIGGYKALVVGKKIDDIKLSRVSGSSLTSGGFNDALDQIKQQAKG